MSRGICLQSGLHLLAVGHDVRRTAIGTASRIVREAREMQWRTT